MTGEFVAKDCDTVDSSTGLKVGLDFFRSRRVVNLRIVDIIRHEHAG